MAETIDDSETFTIALTENGEPKPSVLPWLWLIVLIILFFWSRRK